MRLCVAPLALRAGLRQSGRGSFFQLSRHLLLDAYNASRRPCRAIPSRPLRDWNLEMTGTGAALRLRSGFRLRPQAKLPRAVRSQRAPARWSVLLLSLRWRCAPTSTPARAKSGSCRGPRGLRQSGGRSFFLFTRDLLLGAGNAPAEAVPRSPLAKASLKACPAIRPLTGLDSA
jgi:hypothetical protein